MQVFWGKQRRVIVTWEDEERFRATHPELFLEDDEDQMGGASNHKEFGTNSIKRGRM